MLKLTANKSHPLNLESMKSGSTDKALKVLILSTNTISLPPQTYGGVERTIVDLIKCLDTYNYSLIIACKENSNLPNHKVVELRQSTLYNLWIILYAYVKYRPDIIHNFGRTIYIFPLVLFPVKIVSTFQISATASVKWFRRLGRNKLFFTSCSNHMTQTNQKLVGGNNWSRIYNFIDIDLYNPVNEISSKAPLIFLSRVFSLKGAHEAIQIAKELDEELVIAGNADLQSDYWKNKIDPFLNDRIRYIGEVNDQQKNKLLGEAKALLLPIQWHEPFGLVFVEALACGTPVLTYNKGAAPEILEHGKEGFLAETKDQLKGYVSEIHSIDRKKCREKAEQFDYRKVALGYHHLYQQIITR